MPTITVYVAGSGTALAEGGTSNAGHMWFTLNPGNGGTVESYGFAPVEHKSPNPFPVVGEVKSTDNTNYLSHEYARTIEITQAQYDALKAFANDPAAYGFDKSSYWAPSNSCVDFTWKALQVAGLNHTGYQGSLWPTSNVEDMRKFVDLSPFEIQRLNDFLEKIFPLSLGANIDPTTNSLFGSALNWVPPRRDPLVLDLDGNGITTSAINPAAPILFDQDGDGTKTATGWIGAGEAIVVRDLNGNGLIDSGRELFGDSTVLTHGPKAGQLAANGFEALADLDSNGDGKFDASDADFASVKLWKDANQDGISQASELFTFADLGVASIKVAGTTSNVNLGGGNTQTFAGSFTKTTGAVGDAGTAQLAGSLLLANNNFYRQFTDDPAITTAAATLPQMTGAGAVRDLRPAMSLGTAQAQDLQAKLTVFAADVTRSEQRADLDALVQSWGATSTMQTSIQTNRTLANPSAGAGSITAIEQFAQNNPSLYAQITALEQFNGTTILDHWVRASGGTNVVSYSAPQEGFIHQAYNALRESVYDGLLLQTRLKPYLDDISLTITSAGIQFDFNALNTRMANLHNASSVAAIGDLMDMRRLMGNALEGSGWDGLALLTNWLVTDATIPAVISTLNDFGISGINSTGTGNSSNEILIGSSGGSVVEGGGGDDMLLGGSGNDTLHGGAGVDTLHGGAGADTYVFNVGDGLDTVLETQGVQTTGQIQGQTADTLQLNGMLVGELLIAQDSDNLTLTHINGQDKVTVAHWFAQDGGQHQLDTLTLNGGVSYDLHTLQLGGATNDTLTGTTANDILIGGAGDDILITGQGDDWVDGGAGTDQMTGGLGDDVYVVDNTLDTVTEGVNEGVDTIQSSVTYTLSANVENLVLTGAAAINGTGNALNNVLTGNGAANILSGGLGNDVYIVNNSGDVVIENLNEGVDTVQSTVSWTLSANVENLALTGNAAISGSGNALDNVITGNSADNTLDGGAGTDILFGGLGNDSYKFGFGYGHDTVIDAGGVDSIQMATGVLASDVTLSRDPRDPNGSLVLTLTGGADTLSLQNWYSGTANQVEQIIFSDGTVWKLTQTSGVGNNYLSGTAGNDILNGLGGDDTLTGNGGSDVYDGGAGNDTIYAGASSAAGVGNTTYKFGFGSGQDVVYESYGGNIYASSYGGGTDTIQMAAGVLASDVSLRNDGNNNLVVSLTGGADTLTVNGWYGGTASQVEQISFADGTLWNLTQLAPALPITGTAGSDTVNELDNVLIGDASSNVLNGGLGADRMTGGLGNDTYVVDNPGDAVIEYLDEGIDTVQSSIDYSLGPNLENLTLTGNAAINGTGNTADNVLLGNSGANTLTGNAGNDTLNGGAGADILVGGTGNDTYWLGRGYGFDSVTENDATSGNTDVARFDTGIATDQLWFTKSGNNLDVSIIGTTDKLTMTNWYLGSQYQVEQFKTSDGKTLLDSQVQNLVSAMAGFAPPAVGETTLSASYAASLTTVIAANWQ